MDFTREPVIETVITPREGCKLVVRSSKSSGQEEYFVDAVEVISFGHSLFFRSLERPKPFLVPVSDYEILEVREARMVLKNVGLERSIKIGGGRETLPKLPKELPQEREPLPAIAEEAAALAEEVPSEGRLDKKRGRRHYRRRRGRDEILKEGEPFETPPATLPEEGESRAETPAASLEGASLEASSTSNIVLSSILPPPPTLISETIARYKDNAMFKGAFFVREEKEEGQEQPSDQGQQEEESPREAWISDEAEEEIFRHRASSLPDELPTGPSEESNESANANEGHLTNGA